MIIADVRGGILVVGMVNIKTPQWLQERSEPIRTYVQSLRDVRNAGSLVFLVLVVLVSWSTLQAIQTNYQLQQQVERLAEQNDVDRLKNENAKLKNQYYTTSQYMELTARQNFGLAAPGETELLVPRDVAMAHTVPMPQMSGAASTENNQSVLQRNFQEWINFFFHRNSTN